MESLVPLSSVARRKEEEDSIEKEGKEGVRENRRKKLNIIKKYDGKKLIIIK